MKKFTLLLALFASLSVVGIARAEEDQSKEAGLAIKAALLEGSYQSRVNPFVSAEVAYANYVGVTVRGFTVLSGPYSYCSFVLDGSDPGQVLRYQDDQGTIEVNVTHSTSSGTRNCSITLTAHRLTVNDGETSRTIWYPHRIADGRGRPIDDEEAP